MLLPKDPLLLFFLHPTNTVCTSCQPRKIYSKKSLLHKTVLITLFVSQKILSFFHLACLKLRQVWKGGWGIRLKVFPGAHKFPNFFFWDKGRRVKRERKVIVKGLLRGKQKMHTKNYTTTVSMSTSSAWRTKGSPACL